VIVYYGKSAATCFVSKTTLRSRLKLLFTHLTKLNSCLEKLQAALGQRSVKHACPPPLSALLTLDERMVLTGRLTNCPHPAN